METFDASFDRKKSLQRVVMAHRVAKKWEESKEWESFIKSKTFPHPDTKNTVKFDSLPATEQKRIRKEWRSSQKKNKSESFGSKVKRLFTDKSYRSEVFQSAGESLKKGMQTILGQWAGGKIFGLLKEEKDWWQSAGSGAKKLITNPTEVIKEYKNMNTKERRDTVSAVVWGAINYGFARNALRFAVPPPLNWAISFAVSSAIYHSVDKTLGKMSESHGDYEGKELDHLSKEMAKALNKAVKEVSQKGVSKEDLQKAVKKKSFTLSTFYVNNDVQ